MIAIKEMNMPERCEECKFCLRQETNDYGSFGKCLLQKDKRINCLVWSRDDNCPLVEVGTYKDCKSIKVLDKEPCENAVSREAVLAIAGDSCLDLDNYEDTKAFCDEIKELPFVVHTQKTGQWIFVDNVHEHARCSECDYGNVDLFDEKPHNYCPNCGSFMMDNERTLEYADQDTMISAT